MTRIVVAEDHTLVREGLTRMLSSHDGFEVVGEARDGHEAIDLIEKSRPDVVVMDISMPNLGGLEATRRIRKISPNTRVIILSMHEEEEFVLRALKEGASAYVVKTSSMEELMQAINTVQNGQMYLSPAVTSAVVDVVKDDAGGLPEDPLERLTPREVEVLTLVAHGRSSKEIAALLVIGQKTVETHRANISQKLGLRNLPEMVRFAIRHRLVEP